LQQANGHQQEWQWKQLIQHLCFDYSLISEIQSRYAYTHQLCKKQMAGEVLFFIFSELKKISLKDQTVIGKKLHTYCRFGVRNEFWVADQITK